MTTSVTSELLGWQENSAHSITWGALTSTSPGRWSQWAERSRICEDRATYERAHGEYRSARCDDREDGVDIDWIFLFFVLYLLTASILIYFRQIPTLLPYATSSCLYFSDGFFLRSGTRISQNSETPTTLPYWLQLHHPPVCSSWVHLSKWRVL